jgi:hypothetical protein
VLAERSPQKISRIGTNKGAPSKLRLGGKARAHLLYLIYDLPTSHERLRLLFARISRKLGAPCLDFETWESTTLNLEERDYKKSLESVSACISMVPFASVSFNSQANS